MLFVSNIDDWPGASNAPPPGTVLCASTELKDRAARVFVFGRGWTACEIIVVRDGRAVHAYLNRCAHLALPLNIDERVRTTDELLLCDHHSAAFRFRDGYCTQGPCAGASLIRVPIILDNGRVTISEPIFRDVDTP
jgi:nitrite reductase/ring-hydroxylating ferredoxin subunit